MISYSVLNGSDHPVEIVPPQIQVTGRKASKKKKKEGKGIISDQLEIRSFRLSTTRLERERTGAWSSTARTSKNQRKSCSCNSPRQIRSTSRS